MSKLSVTDIKRMAGAIQDLWINLALSTPVMPESLRIELTEQCAKALFESGHHGSVSAIGYAELAPEEEWNDDGDD